VEAGPGTRFWLQITPLHRLQLVVLHWLSFQELRYALKVCNFFFTSVFVLEAAVKIISQGFLRYFSDRLSFEHSAKIFNRYRLDSHMIPVKLKKLCSPCGMLRCFRRNVPMPQHATRPGASGISPIVHVVKFAYDVRNY